MVRRAFLLAALAVLVTVSLILWRATLYSFDGFACSGDAEYCRGELNEVVAVHWLSMYALSLAGSLAVGTTVFTTSVAAAWLARRVGCKPGAGRW